MKLFRRLMTLLGIIPALFVSMAATADYSPVMEKFLKTGELRVGMSGNQPPLNTRSRDGGLIGLEVELAKQLASAMGVEVKFVEKPFGDLLAALDKGEVDIVMSGVSITASRSTRFAFAGPYMMSGRSVLTKSETLAAARGPDAMNQPQFKFAALDNSTSKDFVEKYLPKSKLVLVKDLIIEWNRACPSPSMCWLRRFALWVSIWNSRTTNKRIFGFGGRGRPEGGFYQQENLVEERP